MLAFNFAYYNDLFRNYYPPARMPDPRYGVRLEVSPASGAVWRVIGIHHLGSFENGFNHNIYLDVLDQQGNRIYNSRVAWGWKGMRADETPRPVVIDKPGNEPGANIPLYYNQTAFVSVGVTPYPSDVVYDLHTRHDDEPPGNSRGHHSFYVVFQLTDDGGPLPPPVERTVSILVEPEGRIEWVIGADGSIKAMRYTSADRRALGIDL